MIPSTSHPVVCRVLLALAVVVVSLTAQTAAAQQLSPEMLREAARRSGLSEEEILRRYQEQQAGGGATADTTAAPGRTGLGGIDDRAPAGLGTADRDSAARAGRGEASYWLGRPEVRLSLTDEELTSAEAETAIAALEEPEGRTLEIDRKSVV